jgi:hypothetical protein
MSSISSDGGPCESTFDRENDTFFRDDVRSRIRLPRRLLIASFLYPEAYYEDLKTQIERATAEQHSLTRLPDVEIDTIPFYPGFISPEVFISKILSRIVIGKLEGRAYHGIIIDGLHNVFLQFPRLEANFMFWPVLYETLRIVGLTVVTTHTQFSVKGMDSTPVLGSDVQTVTRRIAPLLQAIVNAADFYLDITPAFEGNGERLSAPIELVTAIAQPVQRQPYFWNPQSMMVEVRSRQRM